ncbi:MAG TPA: STAS domain-containing protein [Candidatus Fermentibacter daniensis]|nr:MAG: hypothetical protein AO394_06980 [Candidatus Fermentibacter daniensis]MBP7719721.1 STAS domain-containing protein [Candidatus Fermentibacter sp.]OQC68805.1 MAG: Anti-sigma F factor antagonist [candidate division Hyd24-12 bacterium ADurb.Bin004]NLI02857.1 STAS domain-containing protein [Candidatus Fermentibacter daniensis]HOZ17006.1 STAS domain-containing protein [Candidatus Fermentibacter daniensis]
MKIQEQVKNGITVLRVSGKLIGGPELMELKTAFQNIVNQDRHHKVLLDLGGVSWMDSSGLGVIVSGHTTISRAGGVVKILNATNKIHELFIITKLITIFETFQDEDEAIDSFGGGTGA